MRRGETLEIMKNRDLVDRMEYGIWSLHAASGLWGDPRLVRRAAALVPPGAPSILPRAGFLGSLHHPLDPGAYQAVELTTKSSHSVNSDEARSETSTPLEIRKKSDDNECNIERNDDDDDEEDHNYKNSPPPESTENNEEAGEESDTGSTNSSRNNNSPGKPLDPLSYFSMDKDETITPVLNGWVLSAYTAMLGRLSAATAALEATEVPGMPSDNSDSDSDSSSYTERSRGESPIAGAYRGYPCGSCDVISSTRPALRKHILNSHPQSSEGNDGDPRKCPSAGCPFTSISRCEMETHVASHMVQGSSSGKKRSLALQRVRYRYEREEYRCTLCSYACTIEKAFQRHLRAHAKGDAPETRVSCAVCGADRSSEVDLSRHMRRHRDDRYFCCDICVFRTVQLKKLIQHRRMHTGEKPHLCPHCAYRSARRDNLRSHVRRVHKKENLYCDTFSPRGMLIAPLPSASSIAEESAATNVQNSPHPSSEDRVD